MPEANYLLSVSWGYIKVCGAYLRSLSGYRTHFIVPGVTVVEYVISKENWHFDNAICFNRAFWDTKLAWLYQKIFPSWWGGGLAEWCFVAQAPSWALCRAVCLFVCVLMCTYTRACIIIIINSCYCNAWVSVYFQKHLSALSVFHLFITVNIKYTKLPKCREQCVSPWHH